MIRGRGGVEEVESRASIYDLLVRGPHFRHLNWLSVDDTVCKKRRYDGGAGISGNWFSERAGAVIQVPSASSGSLPDLFSKPALLHCQRELVC